MLIINKNNIIINLNEIKLYYNTSVLNGLISMSEFFLERVMTLFKTIKSNKKSSSSSGFKFDSVFIYII